jgi:hypothetical protein
MKPALVIALLQVPVAIDDHFPTHLGENTSLKI